MMRKEKYRDKFWSESDPKNDVDFVEVSVNADTFDKVLKKYAPRVFIEKEQTEQERSHQKRRKEKLVRKVFKAAATVLTDRQLQIFVLRTVCAAKEKDIAKQLSVNQSYVSNVLRISNRKIKTALRLKAEETEETEETEEN